MKQKPPEPPDSRILNAYRFGSNPYRFLEGIQARFNDLAAISVPGRAPVVIVTNPTLIHEILSRPDEFKRLPVQDAAALVAEHGLVQTDGDLWRQQRDVTNPAFSGRRARLYADTVGKRTEEVAKEWKAPSIDGEHRNIHREMTALTFSVATEVILGERIDEDRSREFYDWMHTTGEEFEVNLSSLKPQWVPDFPSRDFREVAKGILDLSEEIIERRRESIASGDISMEEPPRDMLSLLLVGERNPNVSYEENQIRDEVAAMLIAGHETTALSLTYSLALLSWHPDIRQKVREEATTVLGEDTPGYHHVSELNFTDNVYREVLRLYPPAWASFREATGDVELGEYTIENESGILLPQWSVHRDARYFENPNEFNPDRWNERNPDDYEPYFPFGSGPHKCVGRQFALSGARLALARLIKEFDIDIPENALDDLSPGVTLRPREGVPGTINWVEN